METLQNLLLDIRGSLMTFGQTVGPGDIVDILIIAYLIYRVLTVMRRTSAGSVIKGIILIFVIAWLSNLFNLTVIPYLLQQTLQMGIIVLIILFQPELRKLFEQMGSSKLSHMFRKRANLEDVEAGIRSVVAAAAAMAKSKTGALIVFEREVGLNDYAVTGTTIDASISTDLILNIFFHDSPLHDGALLIRDGRLLAASCMLPLSNNINLSRDLGMRHKAGIGISERSDAVAVIVSEQSGTISVAVDGMLKRHLARDTFEKLIVNEIMLKKTDNKKEKSKGRKLKVTK